MFKTFARGAAVVLVMVAVSAPSAVGARAKRDPGSKVICKVERSSTSRIATSRRCQTVAEWEADQKQRENMQADRENMLLRNPQESNGTLPVPADLRGTPN
jgi:hypothetical protein